MVMSLSAQTSVQQNKKLRRSTQPMRFKGPRQQSKFSHGDHTAQTSSDNMFALLFQILMVFTATIQGGANNLQPIRYAHTSWQAI